MKAERSEVPLEEPQAKLERALIDEYLRSRGYDLRTLHDRPADEIKAVLREAALHAAGRLAEVEARASYVHEIHGAAGPPE
ncbi:MAG TPA: hypothetical protein VD833_22100 [Vicinamibacterales bacterium]|nr:hypothetical protein [Vicinamibacterales bacterium]